LARAAEDSTSDLDNWRFFMRDTRALNFDGKVESMSVKRIGKLTAGLIAVALAVGVVQAGAQGSTRVLKFSNPPGTFTGIGFPTNSNAAPPVGARAILTVRLHNIGSQFGKPGGAIVGRALLDCVVLAVNPPNIDALCSGVAHVPDGFITFSGNGLGNARVTYYDVTGGVGAYANDRGQIKVVSTANGGSVATVTLYRP
jgi:hypothetical protein